ncbi:MAG: hypothetical protein Nk1A_7020 [Endomicrobiia bacterium]|nr:MAG: hypothetical protein Nk1A_7020 [Endomicrobiia bacterium]
MSKCICPKRWEFLETLEQFVSIYEVIGDLNPSEKETFMNRVKEYVDERERLWGKDNFNTTFPLFARMRNEKGFHTCIKLAKAHVESERRNIYHELLQSIADAISGYKKPDCH